jgi:hypothetical protein
MYTLRRSLDHSGNRSNLRRVDWGQVERAKMVGSLGTWMYDVRERLWHSRVRAWKMLVDSLSSKMLRRKTDLMWGYRVYVFFECCNTLWVLPGKPDSFKTSLRMAAHDIETTLSLRASDKAHLRRFQLDLIREEGKLTITRTCNVERLGGTGRARASSRKAEPHLKAATVHRPVDKESFKSLGLLWSLLSHASCTSHIERLNLLSFLVWHSEGMDVDWDEDPYLPQFKPQTNNTFEVWVHEVYSLCSLPGPPYWRSANTMPLGWKKDTALTKKYAWRRRSGPLAARGEVQAHLNGTLNHNHSWF